MIEDLLRETRETVDGDVERDRSGESRRSDLPEGTGGLKGPE